MRVGGLVLAAGEGSRFGGTKQLAPLGGRPLLEHALAVVGGAAPGRAAAERLTTGEQHDDARRGDQPDEQQGDLPLELA